MKGTVVVLVVVVVVVDVVVAVVVEGGSVVVRVVEFVLFNFFPSYPRRHISYAGGVCRTHAGDV